MYRFTGTQIVVHRIVPYRINGVWGVFVPKEYYLTACTIHQWSYQTIQDRHAANTQSSQHGMSAMIGRVLDALSDDILNWQLISSRPVGMPDHRHGTPGSCFCHECLKQMYFWYYEGPGSQRWPPSRWSMMTL